VSFHLGSMVAYDCETTGVDVEHDRIVTAALVTITPGEAPDVWSTVINPGVPVPDAAAEVHGWTTERVQVEGKDSAGELEWIAQALTAAFGKGTPVVIANAPFDLTILDRELRRHNLPTLDDRLNGLPLAPVIDVMCVDKALDRYRKGGRKLVDLCGHYGVRIDDAHQAAADATAAARVAYRLGQRGQQALADPLTVADMYGDRRYPKELARAWQTFGQMSLPELHVAQVGWYRDQAEGLAQFWRQKANQLEHEARRSSDDAERETLLADAEKLRTQADAVTFDWPMRPWGGAR
jgi:DNA polymerase III subunit epsilon